MTALHSAHVAEYLAQQVMLAAAERRPFAQAIHYMAYKIELARATPTSQEDAR